MKNINTKDKLKKDSLMFLIVFIISLIIFIPFLHVHYATDSYNIENIGYIDYAINYSLKDGRIFMAGICYIANFINMPLDVFIIFLTVLALIINCITIIKLKNIILDIKKNSNFVTELLITFVCFFTIFNFMYIENMLFVECFVMSLSILFYLMAARELTNKNKKYILKTLLLVVLGILCYQGTFSMLFISILVLSLQNKEDKYKNTVKNVIIGAIILLFAIAFQFLIIKINENIFDTYQERLEELNDVIQNVRLIFYCFFHIIAYTGYVYPKYMYIAFIVILECLIAIKAYKDKLDIKFLYDQFLIIFISIIAGISISIIGSSGFSNARIRYSIGTTIGFLLLHLYCNSSDNLKYKKKINFIIIGVFIIYAITVVFNYINIMNNTLKVNELDKAKVIEIVEYINKYEEENNIEVKNLAIFPGKFEPKVYYKDLKYKGSVPAWSAVRTEWSIEGIIEKYSNRDFNVVIPKIEQLNYYWQNADPEKDYSCINDTLFISYYMY